MVYLSSFSSVVSDFSIFRPKDLQKTAGPPLYELEYTQIPLASGVKRKYNIYGKQTVTNQVVRFSVSRRWRDSGLILI